MAKGDNYIQNEPESEANFSEDENKERGNWSGKLDFLLSCLGYAVGLGNVWRFPYLCYRNGGAVFLIPYAIMLFFVGIPIFVLELALGQFTSSGPMTCWKFSRLFSGIGAGMVVVSFLVAIYYNMIIGWALYYLIASFVNLPSDQLIWEDCANFKDTSNPFCTSFLTEFNETTCISPIYNASQNGVCYFMNGTNNPLSNQPPLGFWDLEEAKKVKLKPIVPSESYLFSHVQGRANSPGLSDLGKLKWELCLSLLGAWVIVYFALIKGIKSSGKVVYFTAIFPYVVLVILFVNGLTLDGHGKGIEFYMSANYTKLSEAGVWKDAAVQIFFSLSASWGGLIALSSYNRFHNDCIRDSLVVAFGNCMTSFFAGFVIFSYLGYLATEAGQEVDEVVASGTGLAFVVYTRAVATIPASPFWAVLFFLMLITLGLDSEFALVETVLTSYMDLFPQHRKKKWLVLLIMSVIMYLLGLTMCTEGGSYMLDLMDTYSGGWNVLLLALLECTAIAYVYGVCRFLRDIEVMIGDTFCFPAWYCYKYWWAACWCFFTPVAVTFVMMFDWLSYKPMKYDDETEFEVWAEALGWLCTFVVVVAIFIPPIYWLIVERFNFSAVLNPTNDWGPALVEHRELIDYVEGWEVNPDTMGAYDGTFRNNYDPNYAGSEQKMDYPNPSFQGDM